MKIEYLHREENPDLAYDYDQVGSAITIVFLGGFRSDMMGTKAEFLKQLCNEKGIDFLRFDYRGHGQSKGEFADACIGDWLEDVLNIINQVIAAEQKLILVGSSMGGWLSLLTALALPDQVKGLIGLAAAPDFTQWMREKMTADQAHLLQTQGYFALSNEYDPAPYVITKRLIEDGDQHSLLDNHKLSQISCPVHLIQGGKDADVPFEVAYQIQERLSASKARVSLIDDADHRLSREEDLQRLKDVLDDMLLSL